MYTADGLSVLRPCCRLWYHRLSLWQPTVPPVDAGSSHWQHPSVLVFILYEYTCHQIVARADMFMSFMFCFNIINDWLVDWLIRLMLLRNMYTGDGAVSVTTILSLVAQRVIFVTACGATGRCWVTAPPCFSVYTPRIYMLSFRRVHTYWYLNWLALRPNGHFF